MRVEKSARTSSSSRNAISVGRPGAYAHADHRFGHHNRYLLIREYSALMCHLLLALPLLALPLFWIFPLSVALPAYGAIAGLSAVIYWFAIQAMNRPIRNGAEGMVGEIGEVIETSDDGLLVRVHNEMWHAVSPDAQLCIGDYTEVVDAERLTLRVRKLDLDARYFRGLPKQYSA